MNIYHMSACPSKPHAETVSIFEFFESLVKNLKCDRYNEYYDSREFCKSLYEKYLLFIQCKINAINRITTCMCVYIEMCNIDSSCIPDFLVFVLMN